MSWSERTQLGLKYKKALLTQLTSRSLRRSLFPSFVRFPLASISSVLHAVCVCCMYIIIGNRKLYKNNKTQRSWHGMVCMWCVWVLACIFCVLYQRHGIISQISLHSIQHTYIIISFECNYPVAIVKGLNNNNDDGRRQRQLLYAQRRIYVNQLAFLFIGNNTSISYLIFYAKVFLFC